MLWAEEQEKRLTLNPRKRLDAGDLPKSGPGWKRTLREALSEMAPGLLVLILSFVLSLLITVRRFVRYELN